MKFYLWLVLQIVISPRYWSPFYFKGLWSEQRRCLIYAVIESALVLQGYRPVKRKCKLGGHYTHWEKP